MGVELASELALDMDRMDCVGELTLNCDMLPGSPAVAGVRPSRGALVGGRGAGPGFMNWPAV